MNAPFRDVRVFSGRYVDSVRLLWISLALEELEGIESASAVTASGMNVALLRDQGFEADELGEDNLIVAIGATRPEAIQAGFDRLEQLLKGGTDGETGPGSGAPHSIGAALGRHSSAALVVIAVPGRYAALEAWDALRSGKDVFLFSDNVAIEDEIALKRYAARRGLLVMGPDCGTSIIQGAGIGFANRVRPGSIGLVGASGTGLQHVSSLIHAAGSGIAVAYGTGSRDLSGPVGAISTLQAIDRLAADERVDRMGLISKPGDPQVAQTVLDRLVESGKPAVACLLGSEADRLGVSMAADLSEAADLLAGVTDSSPQVGNRRHDGRQMRVDALPENERELEKNPGEPSEEGAGRIPPPGSPKSAEPAVASVIAGLFSGGTLCEEARRIVVGAGIDTSGFVDVGADDFTVGRAHPMIDPRLRTSMIAEAGDSANVILFDVVLGDLAHSNPAGAVIPAVAEARRRGEAKSTNVRFVASLIGTDLDPQNMAEQRAILEGAGVWVTDRNVEAAREAVDLALRARSE